MSPRLPSLILAALAFTLAACEHDPVRPDAGPPKPPELLLAQASSFTQVGAGTEHTCALRRDGVVECWGNNEYGQAPPTRAALSGGVDQVRAGGPYTCAVCSDGVVEGCGCNW